MLSKKPLGLSLLTLVIGLGLSVLVCQSAFYVYQIVDRQWRLQQTKLLLLNNAMLGLRTMRLSIQRAGYRGCLSKDPNIKIKTQGRIAPYFCPKADLLVQGAEQFRNIIFWLDLSFPNKLINARKGARLKPGSDFMMLYHVPRPVSQQKKKSVSKQRLGLRADCGGAMQFQGVENRGAISFETQAYYVAETSQPSEEIAYALFQDNLQSGKTAVGRQEILRGVEDLWIEYGVQDEKYNLKFMTANQIKDWKWVKKIKVHLLLRSDQPILLKPQAIDWRGETRLFQDRYYRCAFEQVSVLKNAFYQ